MNVAIPPEFETFARERVKVGAAASEEEAVAVVLRDYLDQITEIRALVDPALASLDRGEGTEGASFMRELLAETNALSAGNG